ncbi:hypothetical protein Hypma_010999 [Hypsizygus marmoreus]|uniref:Uncharacterized protein n=1 Tax=Hypsizygus marmoreus TaxID=39966 RepID=A0A369JR99_HYPMA|nr:hypothetical protein Hypma_010999 [Hypsizygus marmoreus]
MSIEYADQLDSFIARFTDILQSNNTSVLLSIIQSNPTTSCAEALAVAIIDRAQSHPQAVDSLVLPLRALFDSVERKSVLVHDYDAGSEAVTFHYVLTLHLAEFIKDALHETALHTPKHTKITPSNPTLAIALFSASAIKNGLLTNTSAPYNFTRQGLQLRDSSFDAEGEVERQEVVAIGACVHLRIAGDIMKDKLLFQGENLLHALQALQTKNVISYPPGIALLEDTITDAEGGFSGDGESSADVWKKLFPDHS